MKVIIAGSRSISNPNNVRDAIIASGFIIDEVVCGGTHGPDTLGANWAKQNNINVKYFLPDWQKFGKSAGMIRNSEMAEYADALIAVYDGTSRGTQDMINKAMIKGLKVYVHGVT